VAKKGAIEGVTFRAVVSENHSEISLEGDVLDGYIEHMRTCAECRVEVVRGLREFAGRIDSLAAVPS